MVEATPFNFEGKLVLVAEDEMLLGLVAEAAIQDLGGRCTKVARTCTEALAVFDDELPDLILLDVNLKDGTSERIIDVAVARGVPIIVCSGSDSANLPEKFRRLPMLKKPWTLEDMGVAAASAFYSVKD